MRSGLAKPAQPVGGVPMVCHVLGALADLADLRRVVVVVGHGADQVMEVASQGMPAGLVVDFVHQERQRGTGDAVAVALASQPDTFDPGGGGDVIVLPADTPLLRTSSLSQLVGAHRGVSEAGAPAATVLVARVADPAGYGRVVRDERGGVMRIVEQRDATAEEAAIDEVNTSIYCFRVELLAPALSQLSPLNAQGELYLTDVLAVLRGGGHRVASVTVGDPTEVEGVNDPAQLATAEARMRARLESSPAVARPGWRAQGSSGHP